MESTKQQESLSRRAKDLVRLLDQERELYEQLFGCIDARIAAMRSARWESLAACNESEQAVMQRIAEREGLRRHLMDAIGRELGKGSAAGRSLTVSQLAERLNAQDAADLRTSAEKLHPVLAATAQANRLAGFIARGITEHLSFILETVRSGCKSGPAYGMDGAVAPAIGAALFEATG